ncbi:MAG: hypothetical protein LBB81_05785 [Treponema sp.]|jgi:hypothetical protein|nr:hypothetical protein [Treponema sp.]
MNNDTEIQNEDEISLLDLFIVLLRYRKLIAGITIVIFILVAAGYFVYPDYKYKKAVTGAQTQGIMRMEIVSKALPYVSQNLDLFILRPDIIYDSLYAAGLEDFKYPGGTISMDNENRTKVMYLIYLLWIQNIDLNGKILIPRGEEHKKTLNVTRTGTNATRAGVVEVNFKNNDIEVIRKFMESIFELCTVILEENLRIEAEMMVNNYERLMGLPEISESVRLFLDKDFDSYFFLKDFLEGRESAVKIVSGPVFVDSIIPDVNYKNQYIKTGIIIVFAGFFFAVMSAFALNAFHNIRNDEKVIKKIRDALGKSLDK